MSWMLLPIHEWSEDKTAENYKREANPDPEHGPGNESRESGGSIQLSLGRRVRKGTNTL